MKKILVYSVFMVLIAVSSHGQYNSYQYIIGGRAAGMGGAYTALADDSTSLWYNPAGLAKLKSSDVNISGNGYNYMNSSINGFFEIERINGTYEPVDYEVSDISAAAHTLVYGMKLDGRQNNAGLAFGVFVPFQSAVQGTMDGEVIGSQYDMRLRADYANASKYINILAGYGWSINDNLDAGFSAGIGYFQADDKMTILQYIGDSFAGNIVNASLFSTMETEAYLLLVSAGMQYAITQDLTAGVRLSLPGLNLSGQSKTETVSLTTSNISDYFDPSSYVYSSDTIGDDYDFFKNIVPWKVSLGGAYRFMQIHVIALDVEVILSNDYNENTVVNFKAGYETTFFKKYILNVGYFIDTSPNDDVSSTGGSAEQITYHNFCASISIPFEFSDDEGLSAGRKKSRKGRYDKKNVSQSKKKTLTTVGLLYRTGSGDVQSLRYDASMTESYPVKTQSLNSLTVFVSETISF